MVQKSEDGLERQLYEEMEIREIIGIIMFFPRMCDAKN